MSKPLIIGLCGPAGAGKSTIAREITFLRPPAVILSFATPLKAMWKELTNYLPAKQHNFFTNPANKEASDPDLGFSLRSALQLLGTEWGRALNKDLWVFLAEHRMVKEVPKLGGPPSTIIFDDVRFENEVAMLRRHGAVIVEVQRRNHYYETEHLYGAAHSSARRLNDIDFVITNLGTPEFVAQTLLTYAEAGHVSQ